MYSLLSAVQTDGRIKLYGNTYPHRAAIRSLGGTWDPTNKVWYLPAGTDTHSLPIWQPPPPPPPRPLARRGYRGPCCAHAVAYEEYWQGPLQYRCSVHGGTRNDYTGT